MIENERIIRAEPKDHQVLTEITKKSKAYWGYPAEQMKEWSDLLTITEDYIKTNKVYQLSIDKIAVAYYSYIDSDETTIKLDYLFVLPDYIKKGYGRFLMNDFINKIKNTERKRIILDSDPHAQKFYESFGFIKIGQLETSIKDRFLPVMELKL